MTDSYLETRAVGPTTSWMITCEHAANRVPPDCEELFRQQGAVLATHRAFDVGALPLAKRLARCLNAPLVAARYTRLLVDLNRSTTNPRVFSEYSRPTDRVQREKLLTRFYYPYRQRVESLAAAIIARNQQVVHLSIHSFASQLNGSVRNADVGLLYDPSRASERHRCTCWRATLQQLHPGLRVRRNYPYLGIADGLTTHLRRRFVNRQYVGIEIEVNQLWPRGSSRVWRSLQDTLIAAIRADKKR